MRKESIGAGANDQGPEVAELQTGAAERHSYPLYSPDAAIESAVRQILVNVGEDPGREGLRDTPNRAARMYAELLEGYRQVVPSIVGGALFEVEQQGAEVVVVADIPYASMCEHHMLPFVGKAHVGYLPGEKVIGLSKIPRIVDMFARRLQIQERLTGEIADALEQALQPRGVFVVVEGQHNCAQLRGVKKHDVNLETTAAADSGSRSAAARPPVPSSRFTASRPQAPLRLPGRS